MAECTVFLTKEGAQALGESGGRKVIPNVLTQPITQDRWLLIQANPHTYFIPTTSVLYVEVTGEFGQFSNAAAREMAGSRS